MAGENAVVRGVRRMLYLAPHMGRASSKHLQPVLAMASNDLSCLLFPPLYSIFFLRERAVY